jgi:hypothetical protein
VHALDVREGVNEQYQCRFRLYPVCYLGVSGSERGISYKGDQMNFASGIRRLALGALAVSSLFAGMSACLRTLGVSSGLSELFCY